MEIAFSAHKLQQAVCKIVKWEGDIEQAQKEIGTPSNIEIYESPEAFLKDAAEWSKSNYKQVLKANNIDKGIPFARVTAYVPFYVPLNKETYFVYGEFPAYHGGYEMRWAVLTPEAMPQFLTTEEAVKYINILSNG